MPDGYPATKPYRHDRREGWGVSLGSLARASCRSRPTWPAPGPVPVVDSSGSYRLLAIVKVSAAALVATEVGCFDLEPVWAVGERGRAPGVGEVEAGVAGFVCALLARSGRVAPS